MYDIVIPYGAENKLFYFYLFFYLEYYENMNPANRTKLTGSRFKFKKKYFKVVLSQLGELAVWRLHNREILQCAAELRHCSCGHGTKKGGEHFFPSCRQFKKKQVPTRFLGSGTHIPPQGITMQFHSIEALKNVTLFWCCYITVDLKGLHHKKDLALNGFPLIRKPILFRKWRKS